MEKLVVEWARRLSENFPPYLPQTITHANAIFRRSVCSKRTAVNAIELLLEKPDQQ
jgi:hypothetical protein